MKISRAGRKMTLLTAVVGTCLVSVSPSSAVQPAHVVAHREPGLAAGGTPRRVPYAPPLKSVPAAIQHPVARAALRETQPPPISTGTAPDGSKPARLNGITSGSPDPSTIFGTTALTPSGRAGGGGTITIFGSFSGWDRDGPIGTAGITGIGLLRSPPSRIPKRPTSSLTPARQIRRPPPFSHPIWPSATRR